MTLIPHLSLITVLAQTVSSVVASAPIIVDGIETGNEWDNAARIGLDNSVMFVKNDDSNLYILIDVVGNTYAESLYSIVPSISDFVNLVFDVNLDKLITPNVDV